MTGDGITTHTDVGTLMDGLVFLGQPWMARGHCAQTDPEAFYPKKGGSTREAKSVCHGCPVAAECLDYALEHDERHGIWGGLSERERRKIRRELTGVKPANGNTFKTHCVTGHEFTEANTYIRPGGGRDCRACLRAHQQKHRINKDAS